MRMKKTLGTGAVVAIAAVAGGVWLNSNDEPKGEAETMDAAYADYRDGEYESAICTVSDLYVDLEREEARSRVQSAGRDMLSNISDTEWGGDPANANYLSVSGAIFDNDNDERRMESLKDSLDDLC